MDELSETLGRRTTRAAFALPLVGCSALFLLSLPAAHAQEDAISPPAPLQWPTLTGPNANRGFLVALLRAEFEKGGNAELCKVLMREANDTIPENFDWSMCPPQFAAKVNAREGKVAWADGAKPTECGMSCWGRPFMTTSQFRDRPNTHFAMFYGHLDFEVDNPGPNRKVRFGYEAQFRCLMPSGAREGALEIRVVFGQPVIGDPGILESIADFLLPLNISRAIEAGIRRELSRPGSTAMPDQGRCTSIGVDAHPQGDPNFDTIKFDLPPERGPVVRPPIAGTTVLDKKVTVRFVRIVRKPPVFGYTSPVQPGSFHVYLNGLAGYFPDTPALDLPPAGGSAAINLCKTIDMNGADRLQLIFVNSHGGAVWSQFTPNANFGAGTPRMMTTGRTVVVPGLPGPPDPTTGRPRPPKPQPLLLREFELTYTIEYNAPPSHVVESSPATGGGVRPVRPGLLGTRPAAASGVATADPGGGSPSQPCRQI